jgi:hypothetical protein
MPPSLPSLRREHDGKADILFYDSLAKGATLAEGLQKALEAALAALPIPKVMSLPAERWLEQCQFRSPGAWPGRPARRRCRAAGHPRPEFRP